MLFTLKPLIKPTIWGSESWQISGVPGSETLVKDGPREGHSVNSLVAEMRGILVGEKNYRRFGDEFPLLIKFIDAKQDLSIQVHPDEATAHRQGHEHGKTEMWYVMDSAPYARLRCGLSKRITPERYKQMVADDTILEVLKEYDVSEGDCFFIPAGRIHSIGAGCFLAEVQQTSDVTYRIYDFKRKDKNGNYRELHTDEAAEAIDFNTVLDDYRSVYTPRRNKRVELVRCPYFITSVYDIDHPLTLDYSGVDSFIVLIGVKGSGAIDGVPFGKGHTLLLTADTEKVEAEGTMTFLETYV